MDKRTVIAIVLIFIVYWFFSQFIWAPKKTSELPEQQLVTEQSVSTSQDATLSKPDSLSLKGNAPASLSVDASIEEELITLEDDKLALTFSTMGASITKVVLKEFSSIDKTKPVQLIPEDRRVLEFEGFPVETGVGDVDVSDMFFQYEKLNEEGKPGIVFYLADDNGKRLVEKRFVLTKDYRLEMDFIVNTGRDIEDYSIALESGLRDTEEYVKHKKTDYKIVAQIDNDLEKLTLSKLQKEPQTLNGMVDWAGVRTKYFGIAVIPSSLVKVNQLHGNDVDDSPAMSLHVDNASHTWEINHHYSIFIGPLNAKMLEDEFGSGLENFAEIGSKWLQFLSKFFLWLLGQLYKMIPNYGVDIIIFAFIIKVVVYPLTHKSLESGQKMQKVQPMMQELKQKYKGDPKQMNAEMQKLYKEHGVSPLGGCLPLLLQMPIFFALYPALRYSVELRQAHFMFWLKDLSAPDPYYILPVLMGVFMFVQQKMMTPPPVSDNMDDQQKAAAQTQKMMLYMMPVMMVWIFSGLSSGLVLYWMIFNIFSIIQMYIMRKRSK